MADTVKFAIPDSVRLAQYDAKSSIEDVAQNLSSKYKQFADEIKKILESILKQNSENQDQINFRLANKLLEDERSALDKFLNDETFSPDIDELVTSACDEAVEELSTYVSITKDEINALKDFIVNEMKSAKALVYEARRKIAEETKKSQEAGGGEDDEPGINSLSFDSFGALTYFTGWITASFITKFQLSQITAFNNIGQSIGAIESMFKDMSSITDRIKSAGGENAVERAVKDAEKQEQGGASPRAAKTIDLGDSFGARTVMMVMKLRDRQTVQNRINKMVHAGMSGIASGLIGAVEKLGKEIGNISVKIVKGVIDASAKLLKGIVKMTVWTVEKVLTSVPGWALITALVWKFWIGDKFKQSVRNWLTDWAKKIAKKLKLDKVFKFVKQYYMEKIHGRYVKKFVDYFKTRWGGPIENLKKYLAEKIRPVLEWTKDVVKKLDNATHDAFVKSWEAIEDTWGFLKVVFKKPFDIAMKNGKSLFDTVKATGDWLWRLMSGKLSWKEAETQFSKNVWHPAVDAMHDFVRSVVNFAIINGNSLLEFFGIKNFSWGKAVDENGNVLKGEEARTLFESMRAGIMGFGKNKIDITLDGETGAKMSIIPDDLGKGFLEGGGKILFTGLDDEVELSIAGIDDWTERLKQLGKDIDAIADAVAGGAMAFAGGVVGMWVGRIAAIIGTTVAAIFTGGAAFASMGAAVNIGDAVGNILGTIIGWYFYHSMDEAKDYFGTSTNENVKESLGVSSAAESTLSNAWKNSGLGQMAGIERGKNSTVPFGPSLKKINVDDFSEEDRETFNKIGFDRDVYDKFNKLFALSAGNRDKMSGEDRETYDLLANAMAPKGKNFFHHFDSNLNSLLTADVGLIGTKKDIKEILKLKAFGPELGLLAGAAGGDYFKNPRALYNSLTVTGNAWVDMMLKHIIENENNHLGWDEFEAAMVNSRSGGWTGYRKPGENAMSGEWSYDGKNYWAAVPIMRMLLSLRMALTYYQTEIQRQIQRSITLFPEPLGGESGGEAQLMENIQRLLLESVYKKPDDANRSLAQDIYNAMLHKAWEGDRKNKNLMNSTQILFSKLIDNQQILLGNNRGGAEEAFFKAIGGNNFTRIANIINTIRPYATLIKQNKFTLKDGTTILERKDISDIFSSYPNAIGAFLASNEIAEAFKNENGLPTTSFGDDNEKRIARLVELFSTLDNSLIETMNTQLTKILDNFDEMMKSDKDDLAKQVAELLDNVENRDWVNKFRQKISSGLVYKEEYDAMNEKINKLRDELMKRNINWYNSSDGNGIVVFMPTQKTIGKEVQEDTACGLGLDEPLKRTRREQ